MSFNAQKNRELVEPAFTLLEQLGLINPQERAAAQASSEWRQAYVARTPPQVLAWMWAKKLLATNWTNEAAVQSLSTDQSGLREQIIDGFTQLVAPCEDSSSEPEFAVALQIANDLAIEGADERTLKELTDQGLIDDKLYMLAAAELAPQASLWPAPISPASALAWLVLGTNLMSKTDLSGLIQKILQEPDSTRQQAREAIALEAMQRVDAFDSRVQQILQKRTSYWNFLKHISKDPIQILVMIVVLVWGIRMIWR